MVNQLKEIVLKLCFGHLFLEGGHIVIRYRCNGPCALISNILVQCCVGDSVTVQCKYKYQVSVSFSCLVSVSCYQIHDMNSHGCTTALLVNLEPHALLKVKYHKWIGVSIDVESLIDIGDAYISIGDCIVDLEPFKFLCS